MDLHSPVRAGIIKKIGMTCAALIIVAAVVSNLFRSLTPLAEHYKSQVEAYLTQSIGQPVTIRSLKTGWYWFLPVLKFDQLTIKNDESAIELGQLYVGINLFNSLRYWTIKPGLLYLKNAHLTVRKKNNYWSIDGLNVNPDSSLKQILIVLSQQGRVMVRDFSIELYLEQQKKIPVRELNLSMVDHNGHYKIKGTAWLAQQKKTRIKALADFSFDPEQNKMTQGRMYISAKEVFLPQWNALLSSEHYLNDGEGSLKLWFDIKQNKIASVQAQLSLKHLEGHYKQYHSSIPNFYANMLWRPEKRGWIFNADQIQLQLEKTSWPENEISVRYNQGTQSYLIFAKTLLIKSLVSQWTLLQPKDAKTELPMQPDGVLSSFHAGIEKGRLNYVLTGFNDLSWQRYGTIPTVKNLSGALQWSPEKGRLALNSKDILVAVPNYPTQNITFLNGALTWKKTDSGLNVHIKDFALSRPDLVLKVQGMLEELQRHSVGSMQLKLDFFVNHLEQYFPYLPKKHMKKQLVDWLTQNIKKIANATGTVKLQGKAKDFPFDDKTGEFSVVSHLVGGELTITPQWQLIKDIEGFIRVKNRHFEMDIINGNAQGMPIHQMNLSIDDIGKDKETLLIHTLIKSNAQKMLHFILASPVQEKLHILKRMLVKGLFTLDLNLEIPLYPENDTNLAQGHLLFNNNSIRFNYQKQVIAVDEINGSLLFNEKGVTTGSLKGISFKQPLTVEIKTMPAPDLNTFFEIKGGLLVSELKKKFKWPVLSFFEGVVPFNALFKLEKNVLTINSTLQGLAIQIPNPLGKKQNEKALLHVALSTSAENNYRLQAKYKDKLSGVFTFAETRQKEIELKSGQIYLGSHPVEFSNTPGVSIVGSLDEYHYDEWKPVLAKSSNDDSQPLIQSFDVTWNTLNVFQQPLNNVSVKGIALPSGEWSIIVKQKKIAADLIYNASRNAINGFIHYLHLDKIKLDLNKTAESTLQPQTIPNLNLRIDDFRVDNVLIGNVTLKSHSTENQWATDYCIVETPAYKMQLDGQWTIRNKSHQTKLQANIHINSLAKSLEQWHINPVVDANRGELVFNGGWNDALYNFSLAKINGTVSLQLYDGRITNLSKETEEKLGLGKLLSILSLQTIPRRLKLDFSDLSEEGYSFDVFKGNFSLMKGIMSTKDSYIDGPVAYASMTGDLDILKRLYNLNLNISPHITASLPVVATLAGGPIAGVAAWVASKIINQGMQKITAYSYTISGPWANPEVHQLNIIKTMIRK